MPAFLDPQQPLKTCKRQGCTDCPIAEHIHCHFTQKDLLGFLSVVFPAIIIAGYNLFITGIWFFLPWMVYFFLFFGVIEIYALCTHCPHYAEDGKHLQCWANYGSPRLWKYRPGPMTLLDKLIFFIGIALLIIYPFVIMFVMRHFIFMGIYLVCLVIAGWFMRTQMCIRCINFACPLNKVDDITRFQFLL